MVAAAVTDPSTATIIRRVRLWRSDFHSAREAWISALSDWMSAFVAKVGSMVSMAVRRRSISMAVKSTVIPVLSFYRPK